MAIVARSPAGRVPAGGAARIVWIGPLLALVLGACAAAPPTPAPGRAAVHGRVTVSPHEDAPVVRGGAYGDRRLAGAERVDYSKVGFGVVYAARRAGPGAAAASAPAPLELALAADRVGPRLSPDLAAVGLGGTIRLRNGLERAEWVSIPGLDLLTAVAPGAVLEVEARVPGELAIHLLTSRLEPARVFVAPGPFAAVGNSGRFALADLTPGPVELRAWHPRLPPWRRALELPPDTVVEVDIDLGVGRPGGAP